MKRLILIPVLWILSSCGSPPEVEYCRSLGVAPGSSEYGKCTSYYFEQKAMFDADFRDCSMIADQTYPPTLYTGWRTAHYRSHGRYGFGHVETVDIPPDYQRNAEVDALRGRIIEPCMQDRGWNSGRSWEAGRHAVKKSPRRHGQLDPNGGGLPWLK